MGPSYPRQTSAGPTPAAASALFVDAAYVRRCAARTHQLISGSDSGISVTRVSIHAGQISRLLDSLIVDFELGACRGSDGRRPGRRIYDTIEADRRQSWRQLHYRSVVRAEGFVVRTVRAPRGLSNRARVAENRGHSGVEAALAGDLVCLAARELRTALLLAGGERYASTVQTARALGAEVVLLVPGGCGELVDEPLREAATRVIGLHSELFEELFEIRGLGSRRRSGRAPAGSASVGAGR